jgi:hypothetical protein
VRRLLVSLLASACGEGIPAAAPTPAPADAPRPARTLDELRELPLPVAPGSTAPHLHTDPEGRSVLVWLEPDGSGGWLLRLTRRGREGWEETATVAAGADLLSNWADTPVAASFGGGRLLVAWPEQREGGYATRMRAGDGAQMGPATWLPGDAAGPEFGFPSFAPAGQAGLEAYWLDAREMPGGGPMQLRRALVDPEGRPGDSSVVDTRVCDCCSTSAVDSRWGRLVVYRDRSPAEVRDVRVAGGGLPAEGVAVADDAWTIAGCPVNGPAIAAGERELAVAWFSGRDPPGTVQVAFSGDGRRFGQPIRVDAGAPIGRVDIEMAPDESAVVTWMEQDGADPGRAEIRVRRVRADGRLGAPRRIAVTAASRESGFPRAAVAGADITWVWTDPGQGGIPRVRGATAPLRAIP